MIVRSVGMRFFFDLEDREKDFKKLQPVNKVRKP